MVEWSTPARRRRLMPLPCRRPALSHPLASLLARPTVALQSAQSFFAPSHICRPISLKCPPPGLAPDTYGRISPSGLGCAAHARRGPSWGDAPDAVVGAGPSGPESCSGIPGDGMDDDSPRCSDTGTARSVLMAALRSLFRSSDTAFTRALGRDPGPSTPVVERRGLFPLPDPCLAAHIVSDHADLVRWMAAALNYLASDFGAASFSSNMPNGAQRACFDLLAQRAARLLARLDNAPSAVDPSATPASVLRGLGLKTQPWVTNGCPDLVDVPEFAGMVDPLGAVDDASRRVLSDPDLLFPSVRWSSLPPAVAVGMNVTCYAALTARLLRHRKITLRRDVAAQASVFLIGKRGGSRLREIWSGNHVSALAERPPLPPRLGNP